MQNNNSCKSCHGVLIIIQGLRQCASCGNYAATLSTGYRPSNRGENTPRSNSRPIGKPRTREPEVIYIRRAKTA